MIEISINELFNCSEVLKKLLKQDVKAKLAFKLATLIKEVDSVLNEVENIRVNLVKKYGKENEEGILNVTEENMQLFLNEWSDLMLTVVQLNAPKINISDFNEEVLTPEDVIKIEKLVE